MRRIVVLGSSGSGKSTLAQRLSGDLDCPYIELDALHWGPNWTPVPLDLFRSRVASAIAAERWVVDGNYSSVRDLVWPAADTLIWLDYPMSVVFTRVFLRTIRRCITREELWNGNRENFWIQLFDRESILLWVINTWRKQRRTFPPLLREQHRLGKKVIRLRSPQQSKNLLNRVLSPCTLPGVDR